MKKLPLRGPEANAPTQRGGAGAGTLASGSPGPVMAARTTWRVAAPSFLLALAASSEASAAWVGDRFFPSTLATVVPTAADFLNIPYVARLPATAATPS